MSVKSRRRRRRKPKHRRDAAPLLTIVALVPAHNEAESIARTIESLLAQERVPDRIVVIPNGCSDDTAAIARRYPVTVMELPRLENKKSEALNLGWAVYGMTADLIVCMDADTVFPPNAVGDWAAEFEADESGWLGGSSSKFTTQGRRLLPRLQKAEFSAWTDKALSRGIAGVLSGTGSAISGEALRIIAARGDRRDGPWSYGSQVEDFELTYRVRELGYTCHVSPTVRAYTDSMGDLRSLWNQRMKWQVGTVEDLLSIGVNRLTAREWWEQFKGLFGVALKLLGVIVFVAQFEFFHQITVVWLWFALPALIVALDVKHALRIPHRDWIDVLIAALFLPNEVFAWLRSGWFIRSWIDVLVSKVTHRRKDRWAAQYQAEGVI